MGHGHKNGSGRARTSRVVKSFKSSDHKPFERNLTYSLYPEFAVKRTCHKLKSAYPQQKPLTRWSLKNSQNYVIERER